MKIILIIIFILINSTNSYTQELTGNHAGIVKLEDGGLIYRININRTAEVCHFNVTILAEYLSQLGFLKTNDVEYKITEKFKQDIPINLNDRVKDLESSLPEKLKETLSSIEKNIPTDCRERITKLEVIIPLWSDFIWILTKILWAIAIIVVTLIISIILVPLLSTDARNKLKSIISKYKEIIP